MYEGNAESGQFQRFDWLVREFAESLDCSERTVQYAISYLLKCGWLKRENSSGGRGVIGNYTALWENVVRAFGHCGPLVRSRSSTRRGWPIGPIGRRRSLSTPEQVSTHLFHADPELSGVTVAAVRVVALNPTNSAQPGKPVSKSPWF